MKFILFFLIYIAFGVTNLLAQQLPAPLPNSPDLVNIVRGTKTDPCSPQNFPRNLPDGQDKNVDWRVQCFPLNKSFVQQQNCPNNVEYRSICPGNTFTTSDFIYIKSPFYSDQSYLQNYLSPLTLDVPPVRRTYNESDFQPNEGWELIKFHLGKIKTPELSNINDNTGPYLVLYNRYSSTLRIFYAYPYQDAQTIGVTVRFRDFVEGENSDRNRYSVSGLFGNVNGISQPLDQVTKTAQATSFAISPNDPTGNAFFVVDIPVAYDPCTCHWPSFLEFKFTKITEATLNARGRTLGYTGSVSLLNDNGLNQEELSKYLIAINNSGGDGITSQGVSFYKDFNDLIQKFDDMQAHIERAEELQEALEVFQLLFTVTGASIGGEGSEAVKSALEVIGSFTEFYSGKIAPDPPGVIIAETKIVGSVRTNIDLANSRFSLMNPGNKRSNDDGVGINFAPAYNEVMGNFAVLEMPNFTRRFTDILPPNSLPYMIDFHTGKCTSYVRHRGEYRLSKSIKYTFNPAVDIDRDKTTIRAALIAKVPRKPNFRPDRDFDVTYFDVADRANFKKLYTTEDTIVYISPYVSLDCLEGLVVALDTYQENVATLTNDGNRGCYYSHSVLNLYKVNFQLKLMVNYEFNSSDRDGNKNKATQIYTYPIKVNTVNEPQYWDNFNYPNYPFILNIDSDQNYSSSQNIYAWDEINVKAKLTAINGANINLIAPKINSFPGAEYITQGTASINRIPGVPQGLLCTFNGNPLPSDQIVSFCRRLNPDFQYKANEYHGRPLEGRKENPVTEKSNNTFNFSAYPNPTTGEVWLKADNKTNTTASVELTDLMGKTVFPLNTVTFQDGLSTAPLILNGLSSGVYLLKISTNEKTTISKLVIQKD